jgi:glycosyltransferase involved in cell wall biosynthesis
MLDRLAEEKKLRTVALAYPKDGSWWLEISGTSVAGIFAIGGEALVADLIQRTANLIGSSVVHIESLAGLPLNLVGDLEDRNLSVVLSIHDFTLFCRRPHLTDSATGEFCEYCQDPDRCDACLQGVDPKQNTTQADYRRMGAGAYKNATLVIFPSAFLQRQHQALFPGLRGPGGDVVIAPASSRPVSSVSLPPVPSRLAFVGGVYSHKGGALIVPALKRVRKDHSKAVGFVYGNGETALFRQLRRTKGIRIRGYYRQGGLPVLLKRDRISVAVFPSIWPEAYALVVDECLSVGVPVVAFDHGAVGDRLKAWNAGDLVPLREGASGLAESILSRLAGNLDIPEGLARELPLSESTAKQHVDLYRSLEARNG